ncbi:YTHDF3 isoform 11, partial [Pan troglodytes]
MFYLDLTLFHRAEETGEESFSVQNGSIHQKDAVNDDDFEPYLSSQTNQSNSYPPMSDPYMPSYYAPSIGFPYSLGEAAWSTAGDQP